MTGFVKTAQGLGATWSSGSTWGRPVPPGMAAAAEAPLYSQRGYSSGGSGNLLGALGESIKRFKNLPASQQPHGTVNAAKPPAAHVSAPASQGMQKSFLSSRAQPAWRAAPVSAPESQGMQKSFPAAPTPASQGMQNPLPFGRPSSLQWNETPPTIPAVPISAPAAPVPAPAAPSPASSPLENVSAAQAGLWAAKPWLRKAPAMARLATRYPGAASVAGKAFGWPGLGAITAAQGAGELLDLTGALPKGLGGTGLGRPGWSPRMEFLRSVDPTQRDPSGMGLGPLNAAGNASNKPLRSTLETGLGLYDLGAGAVRGAWNHLTK